MLALMTDAVAPTEREVLAQRVSKGADYLWNLERQGQGESDHYREWMATWLNLLASYDHLMRDAA